jgi:hypothetical protein
MHNKNLKVTLKKRYLIKGIQYFIIIFENCKFVAF